eukprot:c4270_g1_i2.p1 GENE.c4270_g1_i2~~c4270_g1_i2.p1  ORF type:complete len:319 (-),score=98.39 c4270_g1_i2:59-1015(-)
MRQLHEAINKRQEEVLDLAQTQGKAKLKTLQLHKDHLDLILNCINKMTTLCHSIIQTPQQLQQQQDPSSAGDFVRMCLPCVSQASSVASHSTKLRDKQVNLMLADESPLVIPPASFQKMQLECNTLIQTNIQALFDLQTSLLPRFVEVDTGVIVSSNGLQVTKDNEEGDKFAISEVIPPSFDDVVFWKVRIVTMRNGVWVFAGIISTNTAGSDSSSSESSFGWCGSPTSSAWSRCWTDGARHDKGSALCGSWEGWQQGDEAIMKLDCVRNNVLSMKHIRTNTVHSLNITPGLKWKIHVAMYWENDSVEILQARQSEMF